jgi:hypothetical protein
MFIPTLERIPAEFQSVTGVREAAVAGFTQPKAIAKAQVHEARSNRIILPSKFIEFDCSFGERGALPEGIAKVSLLLFPSDQSCYGSCSRREIRMRG